MSNFTKKHYTLLAEVIAKTQLKLGNDEHAKSGILALESVLISELIADNPNFNPEMFVNHISNIMAANNHYAKTK
jgi:hypothetical protein